MTGRKPSIYWLICWKYISPIAMVVILVASFVQMAVSGAGKKQHYKKQNYKKQHYKKQRYKKQQKQLYQ